MPKRKNPFGDTAPIQLKTHVGFNQAATVADKFAVHERTKALLFQGSNPQLQLSPQGVENIPPHIERLFDDANLMVTTSTCRGSYPATSIQASTTPGSPQQQGILKYFTNSNQHISVVNGHVPVCGSCHSGAMLITECTGCGQRVCGLEGCLRECIICQQILCQFCTVLNYNERDVRTFCFDCLPTVTCS